MTSSRLPAAGMALAGMALAGMALAGRAVWPDGPVQGTPGVSRWLNAWP